MKPYLRVTSLACVLVFVLGVACVPIVSPAPARSLTPQATTTPLRIPPNIPADHAGRTQCFSCHLSGADGASPLPQQYPDHRQIADDRAVCERCHPVVGRTP